MKLRPWFLALLEEEREKARVQEKTAYSKAFQRKVNPIAKMFALLTIAKRDATGRPAPTRTFASVAANSTHITSAPKCGVRMNDYQLRRCPCVLPLQAAIKLVCALIGRTLCACREGRDPWAKEALGILSREDVATWAEEARKCPLSEGVDMIPLVANRQPPLHRLQKGPWCRAGAKKWKHHLRMKMKMAFKNHG